MPRFALALVPLGVLIGLAAEWVAYGPDTPRLGGADTMPLWFADLATGWTILGAGLVAWARFPVSRVGPLLALTGLTWFVGNFSESSVPQVAWLADQLTLLYRGPMVHALLTYPGGRASTPGERVGVAIGYGAALVEPIWDDPATTILLAVLVAGIAARGYAAAKGSLRRARLLGAQVSAVLSGLVIVDALSRASLLDALADGTRLLTAESALAGAAVILSLGMVTTRRRYADLTDVVVELSHGGAVSLRDSLARILGDPSLEVGYWVPDRRAWLTATGAVVEPPPPGSSRALTGVERDGQPVAILVHDPALLEEPGLVDAISAATRLAASNDRLQGEVRAQLVELEASRLRLLAAGDEARARLEARLHGGAQRQVDALIATLARARGAVSTSAPGAATIAAIQRAVQQAQLTLDDFRVLARGLHPRELTELGFAGALGELASRSSIPVHVDVSAGLIDPQTQADAWFICSEAVTNVARHSGASQANLTVWVADGSLVIEVTDDGAGGADMARGSGLRGLADRAEALGGALQVDSSPGTGTRLLATIPARRQASPAGVVALPVASNDLPVPNTPAGTDGAGVPAPYGGLTHPPQGERR